MFRSRKSSVLSLFLAVILLVCLLPMASVAGAAPLAQGESYTVQKDDSLWLVAEKYLGNGAAYLAIVDATKKKAAEDATFATIVDPRLIQPGWKLWVPSADEAAAFMGTYKEPTEDIFRVAVAYGPHIADPHIEAFSWTGDLLVRMQYDTLVQMRGHPRKTAPLLAESWDASDDLTEWTFHLSKDAAFYDGSPVTAEAVRWSWVRLMTMKQGESYRWAGLADADSVTVIDDNTIRFELEKPFADFVALLPWFRIVNPAVVRANKAAGDYGEEGDYGQAWLAENGGAGSGPFRLVSWEPGSQFVYEAVDDYWFGFTNTKHMDKVIVKIMPESGTQKLSLMAGEIDWAGDLGPDDFNAVMDEPSIVAKVRDSDMNYVMLLNCQRGPLADANVRKAIAYAFDYDSMLETVIGFEAQGVIAAEAEGFVPVEMPYYDIDKAKEYLAMSAWPDGGFEVTFNYMADLAEDVTGGLLLKEGLQKLNITLNLQPTEWTQVADMCGSPETGPGIVTSELTSQFSLWLTLDDRFNSAHWGSFHLCSFYKNDEVDRLLNASAVEPDAEKRAEMLAEVQGLVAEDVPHIHLFHSGHKEAWTARLRGIDQGHPFKFPTYPQDLYYED